MDMDAILASVDSNIANQSAEVDNTETTNSEASAVESTEAPSSTTSVEEVESDKKAPEENKVSEVPEVKAPEQKTETAPRKERKEWHRSNSQLKQAQYSAQKWQKKYKNLRAEYDAKMADFQKYKDLDISKFENDEDRQSYLAWKASRQQNLQDLQDNLDATARSYREEMAEREAEIFNDKVEQIYGNNAEQFHELEAEWGDTFDEACARYDDNNIIRDYVRKSPLGPAIKNVIYGDAELQEELFLKSSGNAMIDATDKVNLLRQVEKFVYGYLNQSKQTKAPVNTEPTKPVASAKPKVLPHLPPRKDVNSNQAVVTKKPQVTGTLTKTESSAGAPDMTSAVGDLYHSIFG